MWEEDLCKEGGKWAVRVPRSHSSKYWEDLCLALIGNQFSDENEVNGIIISLKSSLDHLQVWNRSGQDKARIETLKEDIQNTLKLEE
jgi:translation initiation factor 4E